MYDDAEPSGPPQRDRLLIALDVDGTLLDTEYEDRLRPQEVAAIAATRRAGHVVALCTGRNSRSVNGLLARSGLAGEELPLVLLNGAVVVGGNPYRRLSHHLLPREILRRLVLIFRQHAAVAMVYDSDDRGGQLYHERGNTNSVLGRYLSRRRQTVGAIVEVSDLLTEMPESALEVGTIDEHARIQALSAQIRVELAGEVSVINTESLLSRRAYSWAEVYHRDCSKGRGVLELAAACGISRDNIIAIGDNYNDLDMFAVASHSLAMGNAPTAVRDAADSVILPVSQNGAAVVLEQIAAGQVPGRQQ